MAQSRRVKAKGGKGQVSPSDGIEGGKKGKKGEKFNGACYTCHGVGHKSLECMQVGAKDKAGGSNG